MAEESPPKSIVPAWELGWIRYPPNSSLSTPQNQEGSFP
jgi:hypothetical protein